MVRALIILACIGAVFSLGMWLEEGNYFAELRSGLRDMSIPSAPLNFGKRGQIMKRLGLQYLVPADYTRYFNPETAQFTTRKMIRLDVWGRNGEKGWCAPAKVDPAKIPSTFIMDQAIIARGIPILSVVIDKRDLYDRRTGIFENAAQKGRRWERSCFISYFEKGELVFGTGAGVRVHGGGLRKGKIKSLRFYFRNIYGKDQFKPGVLFDQGSEPLRHLIARKEGNFYNAIGLDISQKIGCVVPRTQPVRVYLNGKPYGGRFALSEHLSREFVVSHYGHGRFVFVRSQSRKDRPKAYRKLVNWANDGRMTMTMAEARKHVDLDNFCRWWISQIYTGNTGVFQGVALLDKTRPESRWFWVNWDMDNSIKNKAEPDLGNIWEQKITLHKVLNKTYSWRPRAVLFKRLHEEDPEFRKYFGKLMMKVLNHRLTQDFLQSRVDYYEKVDADFGIPGRGYHKKTRVFFKHRHRFMRQLMQQYFGAPESYPCRVKVPSGTALEIDGFKARSTYEGWYFRESKIKVRLPETSDKTVAYWKVDGKRREAEGGGLTHVVRKSSTIEPVIVGS